MARVALNTQRRVQPGDSAAGGIGAPDYAPARGHHPNPGAAKGASAAHGGSSRWGFLHPEGAVASPRFAGALPCRSLLAWRKPCCEVRVCNACHISRSVPEVGATQCVRASADPEPSRVQASVA